MSESIHSDRTRMEPDIQLTERDPYSEDPEATRFRSKNEVEEWVYNEAYDCGVDELWEMIPSDIVGEIGMLFIREGEEHAKERYLEEINAVVNHTMDEHLETYVDGQMRLYAGFDVAENGDTLSEGDHSDWEHLRMIWEAGFRDKLQGHERYSSI